MFGIPRTTLIASALSAAMFSSVALAQDAAQIELPVIYWDKSAAIVDYQLKALSNEQLLALLKTQCKPDVAKFKPAYAAALSRAGVARDVRMEALDTVVALGKSDPVTALMAALESLEAENAATQRELTVMLLQQKKEHLASQRDMLVEKAASELAWVKRAAYAGILAGDGKPDAIWEAASQPPGDLPGLLSALGALPDAKLRASFLPLTLPLAAEGAEPPIQQAALAALGDIQGDLPAVTDVLVKHLKGSDTDLRIAAVRGARKIAPKLWPAAAVKPAADAVVALVEATPSDDRIKPEILDAIALGNDLASVLPAEQAGPVRKQLRDLGVQVIVLRTLQEQMLFDLRYFVVEAGKPVQLVLDNGDTMPHNIVVVEPGALLEVGAAGSSMTPPTDPAVKPYVPDHPKVLHASFLIDPGQSGSLQFTAPETPGEYTYLCTAPGHFVRMNGVMLVVPSIEDWEKNPVIPHDPMTQKTYEGQRNEPTEGGHDHKHGDEDYK